MRLAQGRVEQAATTFRRLYAEPERIDRAEVLFGYVETMLAAGDLSAARVAADELTRAADGGALMHRAQAAEARGAVHLAEGDAADAVACLRAAWQLWDGLDMPYDAARVRVRIGAACRALGDEASAALEHHAARETFARLGAVPDLERLDGGITVTGGLTGREVEVLRLVAAGHNELGRGSRAHPERERRSPGTCRTSIRSSGSARGPPRRRTPTTTGWSDCTERPTPPWHGWVALSDAAASRSSRPSTQPTGEDP